MRNNLTIIIIDLSMGALCFAMFKYCLNGASSASNTFLSSSKIYVAYLVQYTFNEQGKKFFTIKDYSTKSLNFQYCFHKGSATNLSITNSFIIAKLEALMSFSLSIFDWVVHRYLRISIRYHL